MWNAMRQHHPIWYGIGFAIIPLFVLVLGYLNVHPAIYRSIPGSFGSSADSSFSGIDWGDEDKADPPIEYISDSFSGVSIATDIAKVSSFWDLWNRPNSSIEFEWRYKVKNLTKTNLKISLEYRLEANGSRLLVSTNDSILAEPGEVVELKKTGHIDYMDALEVSGASWRIGSEVIP